MSRLEYPAYLSHIRTESQRFRDVLATCDPAAPVPSCPDWHAADLLWHLAEVHWFWGEMLRTRPAAPAEDLGHPERPADYDGLLKAYDEWTADMLGALESASPEEEAWTWSDEHTVGFIARRQAHESLIHRLDAEQTAGGETELDPILATDGIEECLHVMYGATPPFGEFDELPHYVQVETTDTQESVWVQIGMFLGTDPKTGISYDDKDIRVVEAPGVDADTVVRGTAASLDAWLWRRHEDEGVKVAGNRAIYDHFREAINHPLA